MKCAALLVLALCACASSQTPASRVESAPRGEPIYFSFGTTEGKVYDSESTRGRVTALLFATTFDLPSQAEARLLDNLQRSHSPRFNAAVVVLEAPKYATLAEVFRTSLGLGFPVAIADAATLAGEGPFGKIEGVPTLVVLDREGREVARLPGLQTVRQMEAAIERAEQGRR